MAGYIGSKASVVSSGAERKKTFTITGATTSLTGLNYTVGKVHVFQNGVRLVDGTDYTATNGTTITLTVAAQNGDNVVVISQADFQVALSGIDDQSNAVAMAIDSNENIGIGTSSPSAKLHVANATTEEYIFETTSNNTRSQVEVKSKDSSGNAVQTRIASIGDGVYGMLYTLTNHNLTFATNNAAPQMTLGTSGNVGIGTVSPNRNLHVSGGAGDVAFGITNAATGTASSDGFSITVENPTPDVAIRQRENNDMKFLTNNTERMRIDSSGRVTMPYQPAFDAYRSSGSYNSGNTVTSMDLNSTRLNVGGHYNTASNSLRFTAPVGGVYQFNFRTIIRGAYNSGHVKMVKNGVDLQGTDTHFSPSVASEWSQVNIQIIVALNANDYMQVRFQSNTNIYGNSYESFNGHLIG